SQSLLPNWKIKEIDKFLDTYNLPKLNQEEIENLKRPIMNRSLYKIRCSFCYKLMVEMHSMCTFIKRKSQRK
uniref:Uncharacterized protein n=1 Tax=Piliocolobus tephrosceles TaxID=591936 RepID=A0A8C9LZW1_9PRIM